MSRENQQVEPRDRRHSERGREVRETALLRGQREGQLGKLGDAGRVLAEVERDRFFDASSNPRRY